MKQDEKRLRQAQELDELALAEAKGEREGPDLRPPRHRSGRTQVYSLRLPLDVADRLQERADHLGVSPATMIKDLVLKSLASQERLPARDAGHYVLHVITATSVKDSGSGRFVVVDDRILRRAT